MKAMKAREVLKVLYADGWYKARQEGSHLHLHHPSKPGTVTVPIHRRDVPIKTVKSIWKQAGLKAPAGKEMNMEKKILKCFAELEKADDGGYGIWFPDFLGCISVASDIDEAMVMAHEALQLHVGSMLEDGEAMPESYVSASDLSGDLYLLVTIDTEKARQVARDSVIR